MAICFETAFTVITENIFLFNEIKSHLKKRKKKFSIIE